MNRRNEIPSDLPTPVVRKETGTQGVDLFAAWYPGHEGCIAQGGTKDEALEDLKILFERWQSLLREERAASVSKIIRLESWQVVATPHLSALKGATDSAPKGITA